MMTMIGLTALPAHAATIFSQTFSLGSASLGSNESVSGNFGVYNGTVGHNGGYGNFERSYYQLALDLTSSTNTMLTFDFSGRVEQGYDGFAILASTNSTFSPANRIAPTTPDFYRGLFRDYSDSIGFVGFSQSSSNPYNGPVAFDLSAFDGTAVTLRFQFASDGSYTDAGVNIDNVLVSGNLPLPQTPGTSAVPEPATWAMMMIGFGMLGGSLRAGRRKIAFA